MNEIQVFNNATFGEIRIVMEDGKPLFCATDSAKALGYMANPQKAIRDHCKADGCTIRSVIDSMGRTQQVKFISEGNLYRLIAHSELASAEKFERWVFDEVLPTLRQTGSYSIPKATGTQSKDRIAEAKLLNARSRASSMWLKFSDMLSTPEHKHICAAYGTQVLNGGQMVLPMPQVEKTYSAKEVGDMYGISAQMVGRLANQNGLKTSEYGSLRLDKSPYCDKEVETWRYNQKGADAIGRLAQ